MTFIKMSGIFLCLFSNLKQNVSFIKNRIGISLVNFFLLSVLVLFVHANLQAQEALILTDSLKYYSIRSELIGVYEDESNSENNLEQIQKKIFTNVNTYYFSTIEPSSTYWGKFLLIDSSSINNHWFFVSYNHSIDSLDIYVYKKSNLVFHKIYRFESPELTTKEVRNKHFTVDFPIPKNDTLIVFIKLKNHKVSQYDFALVEHKELMSKSVFDFYIFGLFYGGLIMMAFYHFSIYISLRDRAYLFYSFYIIVLGLYLSYRDSSALVNLFSDSPWLIEYSLNALLFLLAISTLLYGRFFLELRNFKWYTIIASAFIIPRILFLLIYRNYPLEVMWFDLVAPFIVFVFAVISRFEKNKTATLFIISFFVTLVGYLINVLWHSNTIDCTEQVFNSLYYAVIIQSLLLAIANAYRINKLKSDAIHKEMLEEKVVENMLMIKQQEDLLKEKTDDLDMLLYRASHDIKGPLKSIDGLCYVGQQDSKDKNIYFEHIQSVSKRLQNILNSLLRIAEKNRMEVNLEPVNIYNLVHECIEENLVEYPDIKRIIFELTIPENVYINSERVTLTSVIQNVIENSIKYMDKTKYENRMYISLQQTEDLEILVFEDNGIGIKEEFLKNIFQMFYRANNVNPGGVGLGLYIVKQHIDRLNGRIEIASKEGSYTRFTFLLPR